MKKPFIKPTIAIAVIFAVIATLQSCSKAKSLHFNLKLQTGTVNFIIPASAYTASNVSYGPVTNAYNVDSFIKAQTGTLLGVGNITSVKLASCVISVSDPTPTANFQNFQNVYAEFASDVYPTPFQVSIPNIPNVYTTSINMPVDTTVELKSYIGTQYKYTINGTMRRATTTDMHCTVKYAFNLVIQG